MDRSRLYKDLPDTPGVYLMRDAGGKLLYVGKAGNLRRRVSSYFLRPHDARLESLVARIATIDHESTDTAIEALIREAKLIKEHEPPFNIREKDDKSFLYVIVTREPFPRVLLSRGKDIRKELKIQPSPLLRGTLRTNAARLRAARGNRESSKGDTYKIGRQFGPFTSARSLREALKIIRRIFPYSVHPPSVILSGREINSGPSAPRKREGSSPARRRAENNRGCFDHELGLCPGTCIAAVSKEEYRKNIRNIILLFEGKKGRIMKGLEKEMRAVAKRQEFEKAGEMRRQMFALQHIQDIAFISEDKIGGPRIEHPAFASPSPNASDERGKATAGTRESRIEGYDISNISGTSAVGSMVVFRNGEPDKSQYRKFKIREVEGSNDFAMLAEVLRRRFKHSTPPDSRFQIPDSARWPLPDVILVDGGKGQVSAAKKVLKDYGLLIPIVGLAKGPDRKRNDLVGIIPKGLKVDLKTLIKVRDEAHRFAIRYHKNLRGRQFLGRS